MQIVAVTPNRIAEFTDLREASGRELVESVIDGEGWRDRFVQYLRARQEAGELQCFAAVDDGAFIGMSIASIVDDYRFATFGERRGYVNSVYVAPAYRGQGTGRALTEAAIAWLGAQGCTYVRLRPSPKAEPLYRAMGFVESGELELDLGDRDMSRFTGDER